MEKITKKEMVTEMVDIERAVDKTYTADQIEMWLKFLGNHRLMTFKEAVKKTILNTSLFPTIADIFRNLDEALDDPIRNRQK